jgi:integrase
LPRTEQNGFPEQARQNPIIVNVVVNISSNQDSTMSEAALRSIEDATRRALAGIAMPVVPAAQFSVPSPALASRGVADSGVTYRDYCTDDALDVDRLFGGVIEPSTFEHEERLLRQLEKEGVPLSPPSLEAFNAWAASHPRGRAALDNHRRAYVRYLGYHGVSVPASMLKRWDNKRAVAKAARQGLVRPREKHFKGGPLDVLKLLRARPWREDCLNEAFHHLVALACVTGPRSSEPFELLVRNVDVERRSIADWWQEKKDYPRRVDVPEAWLFNGPGPSVKWYLETVRPKFEPSPDEGRYFLSTKGVPYSDAQAWRISVGRGIERSLGYPIGAHAFRRFCATIRTVYGWSLPQVAEFLDDTERVIETRYVDWSFVRAVGIRHKSDPNERPAIPPLWNVPKDLENRREARENTR